MYYDKAWKKISMKKWIKLLSQPDYKLVAKDNIYDTTVSTIWMWLNHNLNWTELHIFETIVFSEHGQINLNSTRCSTLEQAEKNHKDMCDEVKSFLATNKWIYVK